MSRKSKMKKKKHVVIVKRKSNNSSAKNTNNIVIRIDNRKKAGKRKTMSMTSSAKTEPRKPEATVVPVIRQYSDIGNFTQEIVKRNDAIREEQRLRAITNLAPQPATKLSVVTPPIDVKIPIATLTPLTPKKTNLLKASSALGFDTAGDLILRKSLFRNLMTYKPSEDDDDIGDSQTVRGLDLAETYTPNTVRNLREDRGPPRKPLSDKQLIQYYNKAVDPEKKAVRAAQLRARGIVLP